MSIQFNCDFRAFGWFHLACPTLIYLEFEKKKEGENEENGNEKIIKMEDMWKGRELWYFKGIPRCARWVGGMVFVRGGMGIATGRLVS